MLATIMNCIYVSEIFRNAGMKTEILTPFVCGAVTELFSKDKANRYFEEGKVVFFAGGTGHPYFSTDTGITLRAVEMDADCILLAKSIDGVYDSDPAKNPGRKALRYHQHSGGHRQEACGSRPDGIHHVPGAQDANGSIRFKRKRQHCKRNAGKINGTIVTVD